MTRVTKRLLVTLAAAAGLAACELEPPFDRSNPFDPGSPYPMRLIGVPDTVEQRGLRFTVTIERDPPLPAGNLAISWEAIDPTMMASPFGPPLPSTVVIPLANGEFVISSNLTAELQMAAVRARFNADVIVSELMWVGQRAHTMTLACGTVSVPAACDASPLAIGAVATVRSAAWDISGTQLIGIQHAMQRATVVSRNNAVITPSWTPNAGGTYNAVAVGPGSTWMVITVDFVTDSVRFVVNP